VHEAVQRVHGIVRVADRTRPRLTQPDDALGSAAREPVTVVRHALMRVEPDRLRRHVHVPHGIVERVHPDHVGGLVDRVEVHGLV
jgi:hypothetical protein